MGMGWTGDRMDSDQMQHLDPGDEDLARRLEAYAEARLSPAPSATTRIRAQVMAAADRHAALTSTDPDRAAATSAATHTGRTRRMPWRPAFTLPIVAGLTLAVGVGSAAAALPGGVLYPVRIWTETWSLPGEANARAQAELMRLGNRVAEAAAATAAGDTNAANAALQAYEAIVDAATNQASGVPSARATLDDGVRRNVEVLTVLVDRVPEQARDSIQPALQRAIDRSDSALDKMHGQPDETPGNGPPGQPDPKPTATDRSDETPIPNKPPDVDDETPEAEATPKVDETPQLPDGGSGGGGNIDGGNTGGGNDGASGDSGITGGGQDD